ncbi:phage tail protein [Aminobacter sp. HY435]|uniref:phage tail protein n=1 Tax=Aminobacter sp. HY435 TaxID=2970917 RepID=UPI0022B99053|nr:phage tail protein [Aminobacter sp. HY435]
MVKTPKTRHSKSHREPVTIELEPGAVSRVKDGETSNKAAADPVAATIDDEAVAAKAEAPSETGAATAASGYSSYDYNFDDAKPAEKPKAEPAAASESPKVSSSNGAAGAAAKASGAPARQPTSGLLPGLAGGLIALLVAGGLQYAGVLGTPGSGDATADGGQMQAELASLKSQVADLGASSAASAGLRSEIDLVKAEVETLKSPAGQAGSSDGLAALDERLKQIETTVTALNQGGATSSEITALNDKISGLDAAVKAAGEAASSEDGQIATLQQSIATLTSKVEAQASQPKIALAIAASALKQAVDRGGAFTAELETFAAISPDAPEVAALRGFADKGVAPRADLIAETDAAANVMIAAAKPVNPDAGVIERLVSSAESLVKVRPIGAVEGPGVPETVARIEVAVTQGDFARALAEYDTLPEAAKAAGADFAAKLKARLEVEKQVDQLVANAMKA